MSHGGMSMDSSSMADSNTTMSMGMFFSAGLPTMPLWFDGWMPMNAGSTFGACIGLVALSILGRLLGAVRAQAERAWHVRAEGMLALEVAGNDDSSVGKGSQGTAGQPLSAKAASRAGIPFIWAQELPRGILTTLHVGIGYFLMLAIMSFNAFFFIAVLVGTFIGKLRLGDLVGVMPRTKAEKHRKHNVVREL